MEVTSTYSRYASLVLIGQHFEALGIWATVKQEVHIHQKVIQHEALDKLLDGWINMLASGIGVVEVNTRVRPDRALHLGFGRSTCAEQSTVSRTITACTANNVSELRRAVEAVLRQQGQCCRHDYAHRMLVLDVDMMGQPTTMKGEGVAAGYFNTRRNRRGRQLGRVLATDYDEMVVDRLYDGRRQLERATPTLIEMAEGVLSALAQDEKARENTLIRIDAGGGTDANIDHVLQRGYHILTKVHHWQRAHKLALSVVEWVDDPKVQGRQVGWVTQPHAYTRPTTQLAVRHRDAKGKWHYAALVCSLSPYLLRQVCPVDASPDVPWLMVHAYDLREGGLETQNRCDHQGVGLSRRTKHSFAAQEILVLLNQLAHNSIIWVRNDLARIDARFTDYGLKRMVRDVFQIDGVVTHTDDGSILEVALNPDHPLSQPVQVAFGLPKR